MEERDEETRGEMGGISDTDSDETVIEGSVAESALEEGKEFYAERLSLIDRDVESTTHSNFATELKNINREEPSGRESPYL
uniref:Uncharacterized protein n=1 Tax=Sphaerodactylus townsendi TaxID=933632 RepID=A0ACB8EQG5_9SAUR